MIEQERVEDLERQVSLYELAFLRIIDIATRKSEEKAIVRLGLIVDEARGAFK